MYSISVCFLRCKAMLEHWQYIALLYVWVYFGVATILSWFEQDSPWYKARAVNGPRAKIDPRDVLPTVIFNFLSAGFIGKIFWRLAVQSFEWHSNTWMPGPLQLLLVLMITDTWFYHSHRLMHAVPWLRKYHEVHHIKHPSAFTALYCDPVEMVIVNIPLMLVGPAIVGIRPAWYYIYACISSSYIALNHCGHQFLPKWLVDTEYHDMHHSNASRRFGSYFWDWIYGTA